jgi:nicotinate-nucleotide adenylyltransferase
VRLGLLGGTFDPVHAGHLMIAEAARHKLSLDQVVFIPAGDPPHKGDVMAEAEHRYAMVLLATAGNEAFAVSRRELERPGPSYSLTTIREYRSEVGTQGELFFVAGADTVMEIQTWHRWRDVLGECRFAGVSRPGFDTAAMLASLPPELRRRVEFVSAPAFDLSSTEIRERIQRGEPVRYMVPEAVDIYIRKHHLYRTRGTPREA